MAKEISGFEIFTSIFSELALIIGTVSISNVFIKSFDDSTMGLLILGGMLLILGVVFRLFQKFF